MSPENIVEFTAEQLLIVKKKMSVESNLTSPSFPSSVLCRYTENVEFTLLILAQKEAASYYEGLFLADSFRNNTYLALWLYFLLTESHY